jgi:hypothetical protein
VLAGRLLAHLPLLATTLAVTPLVIATTYAELTNPGEVVTPLVVRVVAHVPLAAAGVVAAWLLGEIAGGIAVRRIVLRDDAVPSAVAGAYLDLARRPIAALATAALTSVGVLVAILPAALAAGLTWSFVRLALIGDRSIVEVLVSVGVFLVVWMGGLVMAGAATAWRSHAWTAEWLRHEPGDAARPATFGNPVVGTIGGPDRNSRGDWPGA